MAVAALLLGCGGGGQDGQTGTSTGLGGQWAWTSVGQVPGTPTALTMAGDGLVAAIDDALWDSPDGMSWVEHEARDLPAGRITWLAALPGDPDVLLAWIDGQGLYRADGVTWLPVADPPASALLTSLNPRMMPVAMDLAGSEDDPDTAWLATIGGLYRTDDAGLSWTAVDVSDAGFNLLFTSVAVHGDQVLATAVRPLGVLPSQYDGLLSAGVFYSDDGGQSFQDLDPDLDVRWPMGAALDPFGNAWLATMDQGLLKRGTDAWIPLGGPTDALDVDWVEGGVVVSSARRGVWRLEDAQWTAIGTAEPVAGLTPKHAIGHDGSLWTLQQGQGTAAPQAAGATVHVALSMHVNLYHSYRGDSDDADGYGLDLDVMRNTLDWLDAQPRLRADWDLDNYWSVDSDWMRVDGADVLAGIQQRVDSGLDDVRLMSWNNGAMTAHTRQEFDESMSRAWDSDLAAFGRVVPGVQPQECMFTPEHVGWYADQGIEWITLFNSATPFSALRSELDLPQDAWTRPSIIQTDDGELTLVPVYHHGDLLDHGGLLGWVEQLHQAETADQLLVIHFDADAESWEDFDQALAPLLDLDYVQFTTIQTYLDSHTPTVTVDTPEDIADGTGDGFQSWAEKAFNHEIATGIATAREHSDQAAALAPDDTKVSALLAEALEPRLLALSTTNFGLAAPQLNPDRMASARDYVDSAKTLSQQALDLAEESSPVQAGMLEVKNVRDSAGMALVEVTLPVDDATGATVWDEENAALPVSVEGTQVRFVLGMERHETRTLSWDLSGQAPLVKVDESALDLAPLQAPFTECDGARDQGLATHQGTVRSSGAGIQQATAYAQPFCDGEGSVLVTRHAYGNLPGVVVQVQAQMGTPSDVDLAESVVLTPLICDGAASSLQWRTFGGSEATRPVRQGVRSWNGQAVDGWISMQCADGSQIQISHRVTERSSLAFAPVRTSEDDALIAPLGTLWGPAPIVDSRLTGGFGMAWSVVQAIGSQFRPQAADWAGQAVSYRLLVGNGSADSGTLDLFAHPPLARAGELLVQP